MAATLLLLFGFHGEQILAQPPVIAPLAVPILIQIALAARPRMRWVQVRG